MPKLEEFDRRSAKPIVDQPMVTVQKRGTFGFNRAAYEALGRPSAVKLLFGAEERVIGFRPTNSNSPKAYPVKNQARGAGFQVAGKKFCTFYGVPHEESRRYRAVMDDDSLLVYLDRDSE